MAVKERLRILVGEDSYLVRAGILQVLEMSDDLEVVGAEGDFDSLSAAVERTRPDVVVTDIRMPPTGKDEGIRLATELARDHPEVGVVVLSEHARLGYAEELFRTGNARRAYILKQRIADPEVLLSAVESVSQSRPLLDPDILEMFVRALHSNEANVASLTEREEQVLSLLAAGASNAAIAEELVITRRAVERHINTIFTKLDLHEGQAVNRRVLAALMHVRSQN
jgi:DNA-binding NarL/FixJ family response regulator